MSHLDHTPQAMPPPMPPRTVPGFDVDVRPERERVVVIPRGELDLVTVVVLEKAIHQQLSRGVPAIVLDLRELTYMDSTGLRLLLQLDGEARSGRFAFSIIDADGPVRRLLTLTALRGRFTHANNLKLA